LKKTLRAGPLQVDDTMARIAGLTIRALAATIGAGEKDTTCGNWTKGGEGSASVGHHDRVGIGDNDAARSWNASHATRGCSLEALRSTGGAGLFYCFAAVR